MTKRPSPISIVLAAGLGTRMKSDLPKVLHRVAGRPLVVWTLRLGQAVGARRQVVVLGHKKDEVEAAIARAMGPGAVTVAWQEQQLGTGHAVRQALPAFAGEPDDTDVLILMGDVPLLQRETIDALAASKGDAPLAVVTARPPSAKGYGRMVRDGQGRLQKIVEDRDATSAEREIGEVNAGIYMVTLGFLRAGVAGLGQRNAQGEFYLTDLVEKAAAEGPVPTAEAPFDDVAGINDRVELARLDLLARRRIAERWMREGVTMTSPDTISIDADVEAIGRDCELAAGVSLRGKTRLGSGVRVDVGCVVVDSQVGDAAVLKPYSVLVESRVGARAQIGPFSHCRPATELADDVHLGNFVETKQTRLGPGAKANHLAYLGDAEIGAKVNVGAGTITCNYDGVAKHKTVIEDGAFIGSDTQLVAPVRVGKGAYVGAGTTVTKDVPPGALAITRSPQVHVDNYADRKKK